jgi:hypothetical protein
LKFLLIISETDSRNKFILDDLNALVVFLFLPDDLNSLIPNQLRSEFLHDPMYKGLFRRRDLWINKNEAREASQNIEL